VRGGGWCGGPRTGVIPLEVGAMGGWWMWQAGSVVGDWDPFGEFTAGTVVFQVGLLILRCLAIDRCVWKRASAASNRD